MLLFQLFLLFQGFFLFGGALALGLVLGFLCFVIFFFIHALPVDIDLGGTLGFGLSLNDAGQFIKEFQIGGVHDDADAFIVDGVVFEAALDGFVYGDFFQLAHHFRHVVGDHLGAFDGDDRAEV